MKFMLGSLISKVRFAKGFLIAVKDPSRTEELLKLTGNPRVMGGTNHQLVFDKIAQSPSASSVIKERRLAKWDLGKLAQLPPESLGRTYYEHLKRNALDEKFYFDLEEHANLSDIEFVRLWIRWTHDILHVLTGFDTSVEGEAGLQAFGYAQLRTKGSAFLIAIAFLHNVLYHPERLTRLFEEIVRGYQLGIRGSILFGEDFNIHWTDKISDYQRELNLIPPLE